MKPRTDAELAEFDAMLDADPGYQEWSETIEQQNREHQDAEIIHLTVLDYRERGILGFIEDLQNRKPGLEPLLPPEPF